MSFLIICDLHISGWEQYKDECFKAVHSKETWNNAQQQCEENYGGHLAHVDSAKHLEWLWHLTGAHPFWIGQLKRNLINMPFSCVSANKIFPGMGQESLWSI